MDELKNFEKSTCKSCGAPLIWIKTLAGKYMPCDIIAVHYKARGIGKDKVVTPEGAVVSCDIVGIGDADGYGYVPHWSTCNAPDSFRNKGGSHGSN